MVEDTRNILLVEPCRGTADLTPEFLTTLQHALARAIQAHYKLEAEELASEKLGEGRYILSWESAEGGAGVLAQILDNPKSFQDLAQEALEICHFKQDKPDCAQACYECLLSYQNQFDHPYLNRHLIKDFLEQLAGSRLSSSQESDREQSYQILLQQSDPNSEYEKVVLKAIYERGLPLPDRAGVYIPDADCKPDFIYENLKIAIFCDGSVHDHPERQEQDSVKRENLKWHARYKVFSFNHRLDLPEQIDKLQAMLRPK